MKKITLVGAALSIGMATTALADGQIGTTSQKGSLIILPKIDVRPLYETYVHITNDADKPVDVKCFWQDLDKNKLDLGFQLTKHQPLLLNASNGKSTKGQMSPFPSHGPRIGELKCWAVNASESEQIAFNHLFAKATLVDAKTGNVSEYRAWHFPTKQTEGQPIAPAGELRLSGNATEYYACPHYLASEYSPKGSKIDIGGTFFQITYDHTYLTTALCRQDFRQDWEWIVTKLDFDIWNADENKFTNPWKCANSVQQVELTAGLPDPSQVYTWPSNAGSQFDNIGTQQGYYRVHAVASSQCDNVIPGIASTSEGLIGVTMSKTSIGGAGSWPGMLATTPIGAGKKINGKILWDPARTTKKGNRASKRK